MDDEEEDMSRPISRWGRMPYGDVKLEERDVHVGPPTSQSHHHHQHHNHHHQNNNNGVGINALSRTLHQPPRLPSHAGDAGPGSHVPAHDEPMDDRGERRFGEGEEEEEEEQEERENDEEGGRGREEQRAAPGPSIETQIGRKLREIGDKFQHDHIDTLMRHQMQNLPAWMRLTAALLGLLFPRQALFPRWRERGEQR